MGRTRELTSLRQALTRNRPPRVVFLAGDRGVGKSRLASEAAREAGRLGHTVVLARAFDLGGAAPYSLFSDSFTPVVRQLDEAALQVLTRGAVGDLAPLFPLEVARTTAAAAHPDGDVLKPRMFWAFTELLRNLSERQPLFVVLEDLHWADPASLELLHFLARQTSGDGVFFLCTYAESERGTNERLGGTESSLGDLGLAQKLTIGALSYGDTVQLLEREFRVDSAEVSSFAGLLYGWTQGNPWLIDAILSDLRDSGTLTREDNAWHGWDIDEIRLPPSVAEDTMARFGRLSSPARMVSDLMAVMGPTARLEDLEALEEVGSAELLAALDELRDRRLVRESNVDGGIVFEFSHPVLRQTLVASLGLTKRRDLHGRCGAVLERRFGFAAADKAEELAYHFCEADPKTLGETARQYLAQAGQSALGRQANAEAEKYLAAALRNRVGNKRGAGGADRAQLFLDLGRAQRRLGKSAESLATFQKALGEVPVNTAGTALTAQIRRRIGLIRFWEGRHQEALEQFEAGLQVAIAEETAGERAEILIAKGTCLQEVGRLQEAADVVQEARDIAGLLGDERIQARVARALVLLSAWTAPATVAQQHGERALELAVRTGDARAEFWAHWGLAISAAMAGQATPVEKHLAKARALADGLGAPGLKAWLAELTVEFYYATGDWDRGLGLAEQAISVSRSLNQTALTVRLLVLAGIIYLERGQFERGRSYVREAWDIAHATSDEPGAPADFFMMIPAHVGAASHALWAGDFKKAVEIGEAGITLAEGSGYQALTIHRLLPIVAEAHLMLRDLEAAEKIGHQLRTLSEKLDHTLGLAWASACDAIVCWLRGDPEQGRRQLSQVAGALEAIPMIPYAARVRRQLAGRLAETGHRDEALKELRRVHEVFAQLGAQGELKKTREMFREVQARPPRKTTGQGVDGLTGRELEIGRLVAARMSNKAIGKALDISARTVSTHLSNIFKKIGVSSRGELADVVKLREL